MRGCFHKMKAAALFFEFAAKLNLPYIASKQTHYQWITG